ncbi:MAG: hypothetical protein QOG25_4218, partial [Acetobacteraceae bacterium]|nr:hypothetical protein [Acetobacteraceae bacterium]
MRRYRYRKALTGAGTVAVLRSISTHPALFPTRQEAVRMDYVEQAGIRIATPL